MREYNSELRDYIDREDAVLIASGYCAPANVAEELKKMQGLVHCRDCKHCAPEMPGLAGGYCVIMARRMPFGGFCCFGVRKGVE